VLVTVEEHHHRVAAELEHIAAGEQHLVDQTREDGVEHVVDVLGPAAPELREPFGERREPGDVVEGEGAGDLAPAAVGESGRHVERMVRDVRAQRVTTASAHPIAHRLHCGT
jgi:hypothetical protein